jgi:hypothetical protein
VKTIQTSVVVEPGHTITLRLPDDIEPGAYQVTLVIDDQPIGQKSNHKELPAIDVGPWPERLTLGHETMHNGGGP